MPVTLWVYRLLTQSKYIYISSADPEDHMHTKLMRLMQLATQKVSFPILNNAEFETADQTSVNALVLV